MRVGAPQVRRAQPRIVVGIVVRGHADRLSGLDVAVVFLFQRAGVVFQVVEDIQRPPRPVLDQAGARIRRSQQRRKLAPGVHVGLPHLGPAAHGDQHVVRKAAQEGRGGLQVRVPEAAERLGIQRVLGQPVEMPRHRHPAPADAERRMDVALRPVEDAAQFVPVGHLVEGQLFDRGAGHDQPVEAVARRLDLGERTVEGFEVIGGGVAAFVIRHADQRQVDLQGRRADQPRELVFGLDLLGHQVQQRDPKRPDVLRGGPARRHDHHALARQDVVCGQVFGQGDRHQAVPCARRGVGPAARARASIASAIRSMKSSGVRMRATSSA